MRNVRPSLLRAVPLLLIAAVFALALRPGSAQIRSVDGTLTLRAVTTNVEQPLGLVSAHDGSGRLFVIEKTGAIRILANGEVLNQPLLDIDELISRGSEQGLLGVAFAPDFPTSRR